jgi:hypothetical protein
MNKIVWVMGQSAAGKETFIKYAMANPDCSLIRQLGYSGDKIIPLGNNLYLGDYERIQIKDMVLDLISKETNAVILIKWQHVDTDPQYGDLIMKLKAATPGVPNEIVLLSVDSDVLYSRLVNKPWWNESTYISQEQMNNVVEILRNNIRKWLSFGFTLKAEIDATDRYKIIESSLLE